MWVKSKHMANKYTKQKQRISSLPYAILLFSTIASFNASAGMGLESWVVYSNPGVPVIAEDIQFPLEGQFVAAIKPPMIPFNDKTKPREIDKYTFGWLDHYYLAQTINAKNYKGKHLHISSYIKLDQEGVAKHIEIYQKWMLAKMVEYYKSINVDINEQDIPIPSQVSYFKKLLSHTEIMINVFLSSDNGFITDSSINQYSANSDQWQRLNAAVDIPENCNTITIAVWMKGFGNLYIDDFVIAEQGEKLNTNRRLGKRVRYPKNLKKNA